jgi:hypothetical protein
LAGVSIAICSWMEKLQENVDLFQWDGGKRLTPPVWKSISTQRTCKTCDEL